MNAFHNKTHDEIHASRICTGMQLIDALRALYRPGLVKLDGVMTSLEVMGPQRMEGVTLHVLLPNEPIVSIMVPRPVSPELVLAEGVFRTEMGFPATTLERDGDDDGIDFSRLDRAMHDFATTVVMTIPISSSRR